MDYTALPFFFFQAKQALHFPSAIFPETGFQISSYPGCCSGFFLVFHPWNQTLPCNLTSADYCGAATIHNIGTVLLLSSVEFS